MDNFIIDVNKLKLYKNQKLKIGILGGSFDPVHIGHIHIAKNALKKLALDELWFSLSPQNPLKPPPSHNYNERFELLQNLIEKENINTGIKNKFKILTVEREENIYFTGDLFGYLHESLPNIEFWFIIGADIAPKIHEWEKFDELIKYANIAIFSRAGYSHLIEDSEIMQKFASKKVKFFPIKEIHISSTQIRKNEIESNN